MVLDRFKMSREGKLAVDDGLIPIPQGKPGGTRLQADQEHRAAGLGVQCLGKRLRDEPIGDAGGKGGQSNDWLRRDRRAGQGAGGKRSRSESAAIQIGAEDICLSIHVHRGRRRGPMLRHSFVSSPN